MNTSQNTYTGSLIAAIVVLVVIVGGVYAYMHRAPSAAMPATSMVATSTASTTPISTGAFGGKGSNTAVAGASFSTNKADLKRYTNTDYGFSIDYPKAWGEAVVTKKKSSIEVSVVDATGSDGFHIQALDSTQNFTPQNFVWSDWGHASTSKYTIYYVGAKAAVRYDYVLSTSGKFVRTIQIGFDTANGSFVSFYYSKTFNTQAEAEAANMKEADQLADEIQFY